MFSGLPGYSPEFEKVVQMSKSSKSLGAALRSIGHVRDNTKAPGDASGSQAHQEEISENRAPHPEPVDLETGAEDASLIARKRPRVTSTRTELFGTMLSDCEVVKESSAAGGPENFRPHEPAPVSPEERNFIGFLADLPSKSEWEEMSQSTSTELLRQMMGVFGQVCVSPGSFQLVYFCLLFPYFSNLGFCLRSLGSGLLGLLLRHVGN